MNMKDSPPTPKGPKQRSRGTNCPNTLTAQVLSLYPGNPQSCLSFMSFINMMLFCNVVMYIFFCHLSIDTCFKILEDQNIYNQKDED